MRESGTCPDGCGHGDVKTMMSMRLGPGPDTPRSRGDDLSGVQGALDELARKCGITGLAG